MRLQQLHGITVYQILVKVMLQNTYHQSGTEVIMQQRDLCTAGNSAGGRVIAFITSS